MRAPEQEATATAGQYQVQAQFASNGWGPLPNPYHDVGTDLVVLPRDVSRLEVGLPIGVQVKSSINKRTSKYFTEPVKNDDGEVVGWWFRESTRAHFDYWKTHGLPHLIVLHDRETQESYWAHITDANVVAAGNGAKIFVPADQRIDQSNFDALLAVAKSKPSGQSWEGSAWTSSLVVPSDAEFRYALLTPRLVAPHPNETPNTVSPAQAIAVTTQCRFRDLDDHRQLAAALPSQLHSPYPSPETAAQSEEIGWKFYAALHRFVKSGDASDLVALSRKAKQPHIRAAVVAASAAAYVENGRPREALELLDATERKTKPYAPVDRAWLDMHRARVLLEQGHIEDAQRIAVRLLELRTRFSADPTALTIVASATVLIFTTAPWTHQVADAITNTDTAARWWHSQVVAWGLGNMLDDAFNVWSRQSAQSEGQDRRALEDLRSASLLSGFSADQNGWCSSYARIAKYVLPSTSRNASLELLKTLISDLRLAGADDELKAAVRRLLTDGPALVVSEAGSSVDFSASTVTTSLADITLVTESADVLDHETADQFARWAIKTLKNGEEFRRRVRPTYDLKHYVAQMLQNVAPSCSRKVRREIIRFIIGLSRITDAATGNSYAAVLSRMDPDDWTAAQIDAAGRRKGDDPLFARPLAMQLAQHDPAKRRKLLAQARRGSLSALAGLGDVSKLPVAVVRAQIAASSQMVRDQIESARHGSWARAAGAEPAHVLALLNVHHHALADWTAILEMLAEPLMHPTQLRGAVQVIRAGASQLAAEHRRPVALALKAMRNQESPLWREELEPVRLAASEAIDQLDEDGVSIGQLWGLMGGGSSERRSLARMLGRRHDERFIGALEVLAHDQNSGVRAEAARALCRWLLAGISRNDAHTLLTKLISDLGTDVPTCVARELKGGDGDELAQDLLGSLRFHISVTVRTAAQGDR